MVIFMIDLLVITPHPDDETLNCGGLLSKMTQSGHRVATITLTKGERGRTLGVCSSDQLPFVRIRELQAAINIFGIDTYEIFDFPDSAVNNYMDTIVAKLVLSVERLQPAILLTFPPNGLNGHPDHVATHHAVHRMLKCSTYKPQALYYFALPQQVDNPLRTHFLPPDTIQKLHLPSTHAVDITPYVGQKLLAMGQYETQARSIVKFLRQQGDRLQTEFFCRIVPIPLQEEKIEKVPWLI
jgi:N-acetylglucosamine malate deacetylase 2